MKPITQDKGWEERFDKKFTCEVEQISGKISKLVLSDRYGKPVPFISDQLKYFIKSLLKTKGIEVIDECYNIFQRAFLSIKGRIDYDNAWEEKGLPESIQEFQDEMEDYKKSLKLGEKP